MLNFISPNTKRMNLKYVFITTLLLYFLNGCKPTSNKEKIIGKWESASNKKSEDIQGPDLELVNRKLIINFNQDLSMKLYVLRGSDTISVNSGTYNFENEMKHLVIYREGKKERKNIADISELSDSDLILIDISGNNDTLYLSRMK